MQSTKTIIFSLVIIIIFGLIFYFQSQKPQRTKESGEIKPSITSVGKEEKAKNTLWQKK